MAIDADQGASSGSFYADGMLRVASTILLGGFLVFELRSADTLELKMDREAGRVEIVREAIPLLVYSFAGDQFKPYVKELRTPGGENVLLDAPADHLHHHGLMYAIRVNGINFWEELPNSGRQKHVRFLTTGTEESKARLRELIHWIGPAGSDDQPLLIEERTLDLVIDAGTKELGLYWSSKFTVGPQKVTLHGSAYNGLGLRFPPEWNGTARHGNSESAPYSAGHTGDVTRAIWATVRHQGKSGTSTVALLGRSSNAGETRFFSMNNPFAYLSVTQNLEQQPIEYTAGDRFELNYLLLLYAGEKTSEQIHARYLQWRNKGGS